MSVTDVKNAFKAITQDRRIDVKDVDTVLQSAGNISTDEQAEMKKLGDEFAGMMDPDAKAKLAEKLGEVDKLRQYATQINAKVEYRKGALHADQEARMKEGVGTKTFGGSAIPETVKAIVRDAMKNGASAYDVLEQKADPVFDTSHGPGELTIEGKYNPYAQEQKALDSMAFDYTELTPQKVKDDMSTTHQVKVLAGYDTVNGHQVAKFKDATVKGNGRITELYDEASWSETKARTPDGQKYASNFAILADGSLHAVPASRRSAAEPWRILTTASLARGKQMLFNGHLHMENGVVTYVGMSGRLCKLQEKGEKFVDPIALIKAWGFEMAPGLKVTNEG